MFKFLFLTLTPFLLFANLSHSTNYNKELRTLNAFDIQPSFLYDPIMIDMRNKNGTYAKDQRFFEAMDAANTFIPALKDTLSQYDIPPEFLYLAMAESNFHIRANSVRSAAGLWQFMPQTGKNLNLKIDEYVDERKDLIKSTKAAAEYLSTLYDRFGKWYLAALAYNCGEGCVTRAIEKAGSDKLSVLLNPKEKYIPKESRFFIRKIVAFALIGNDEQLHLASENEYLLNRANANTIATVKLSSGESLSRIAKILDMPLEELKKLNRHLKYDFIPPYAQDYEIYIPYAKLSEFKQKYYEEPIQNIYKVHIVAKGDNLFHISAKYGVSYKIIKDFNNLRTNHLSLNQKLIIPISKTV